MKTLANNYNISSTDDESYIRTDDDEDIDEDWDHSNKSWTSINR